MRHDPVLLSSGLGCWARCSCGWESERWYRAVLGAHLRYGRHLLEARR